MQEPVYLSQHREKELLFELPLGTSFQFHCAEEEDEEQSPNAPSFSSLSSPLLPLLPVEQLDAQQPAPVSPLPVPTESVQATRTVVRVQNRARQHK